ncbi:MAG: transposase [Firmicutes bacterium]|nr:transposase [Bacillota bacterium]
MGRELPKRKIIRLEGYDYAQAGYYFITICVKDCRSLLGSVVVGTTAPGRPFVGTTAPGRPFVGTTAPGRPFVGTTAPGRPFVELTPLGECVNDTIKIANNNNVKIDKYVIMPNHIHMIVDIGQNADDRGRSSLQQTIRSIKSYVTKWAGYPIWQPRFYDHVVRNEEDYRRIWQYIDENPVKWKEDRYYKQH